MRDDVILSRDEEQQFKEWLMDFIRTASHEELTMVKYFIDTQMTKRTDEHQERT